MFNSSMIKEFFLKFVSFGVYPEMDEGKRISIQVASFDGLASLIVICFYSLYSLYFNLFPLVYFHFAGTILCCFGLYFLKLRRYDLGRMLLHFVGLSVVFLSVDGVGISSGYEHYYFTSLTVPFITFTSDELKKSIFLSLCSCIVVVTQLTVGAGLIVPVVTPPSGDRLLAILIVFSYVLCLFSISRWQMNEAQRKIKIQQSELIHSSNIAALGEMSGGVAHEINNPLQILSGHIDSLKRQMRGMESIPPKMLEQLSTMEKTVDRMAKLVKGLKNLSRHVADDPYSVFTIGEAIDDVLIVSSQRLKDNSIDLVFEGDKKLRIKGHLVQVSQVLINLLNNSIDALSDAKTKWIKIEIIQDSGRIFISITDSGNGIPDDIVKKMMNPFFTTKAPGRGTGLGLSISHSIIEKAGGRLIYDAQSANTKFIIDLPAVNT